MAARSIPEIIAHIRMVCDNSSVDTTLIQTEDLYALCDAAESKDEPVLLWQRLRQAALSDDPMPDHIRAMLFRTANALMVEAERGWHD